MSRIHIYIPCTCAMAFDCISDSIFSMVQIDNLYREQETQAYTEKICQQHIRLQKDMYYELIVLYWAMQSDQSDYIGFFTPSHYISFSEKTFEVDNKGDVKRDFLDDILIENHNFEETYVWNMLKKYDVVFPNPILVKSVKSYYLKSSVKYERDLEILLDIISEHYPEYLDTYKEYLEGTEFYPHQIFIMKYEIYQEYTAFLFNILSRMESYIDYTNYGYDMKKVLYYCAEILLGVFALNLKKRNVNMGIRQRYEIQNVSIEDKLTPAFKSNYVPVVLTCSENYYMYVCVTLQSVLDNISDDISYDIIIVHSNMTNYTRKVFERMVHNYDNVSLRFYNISRDIRNCSFKATNPFVSHVTVESYYRVLVQSVFANYDKIIWLDSDMIIKKDVKELFLKEIGDNLLAAAIDPGWHAMYNDSKNTEFRDYVKNVLKLPTNHKYFQQGTLLINVKEFNRQINQQKLIAFASSCEFMFYDQDIFNVICNGKVYYLDMQWNVLSDVGGDRVDAVRTLAPTYLSDEYMRARENPYVIHYAGGIKPWQDPTIDYAYEFWNTARRTEVYESLIKDMAKREANGAFLLANKMSQHKVDKAVRQLKIQLSNNQALQNMNETNN